MKLGKHFAGVALFLVIFGSTVIITNFLTAPIGAVPPVKTETTTLRGRIVNATSQPVTYKVRLVSLDFINGESYTTLSLKREPGQLLPKRLWVQTYYFTPERPGRVQWDEPTEILVPDTDSERLDVTARSACEWCNRSDMPKAGYFARIFVSTESADGAYPPDGAINLDLTTATPVLVQAERGTNR